MNDKERELMRDLEMTKNGRDFLENVELPKHTNPLPGENSEIKPPIRINAIIIPEGATNGDMIKMLFPDVEVDEKSEATVHLKDEWHNPLVFIQIPKDIWNAPYKKEVEE